MPAFNPRMGWEFDDEGNFWIQIYTENEDVVVYDVFSLQGYYLKQVTVPHKIREFKDGKVYSILSTEEGYMVVKRFKLKKIKQ